MAINIKPSKRGSLHRAMGIPQDQPIPVSKLRQKKRSATGNMAKKINFAINAKTKFGK